MRIGIIGAGFSGTAVAANLYRQSQQPLDIYLFDKSGKFGAGPAYSTPYSYHLLNVRAEDMSIYEHEPPHFVNWLLQYEHEDTYSEPELTLPQQFVPRVLYGKYLQHVITEMQRPSKVRVHLEAGEVIDILPFANHTQLVLRSGRVVTVDKVVLALGNNPATRFPFPVAEDIHCIDDPWDYRAVEYIPSADPVLIIGSGLSMIDAVLTLHHHGHQRPVHVLSRHGLLPLPHTHLKSALDLTFEELPKQLPHLTKQLRTLSKGHIADGGDWRAIIQGFRAHLPSMWQVANEKEKLRFLRHLLPYWNIHRHRVHTRIMGLLTDLQEKQRLHIHSGRVQSVANGKAIIKPRHSHQHVELPCSWLINCMGPSAQMSSLHQPLINTLLQRELAMLDPLKLGFHASPAGMLIDKHNALSSSLYTVGPPTKGVTWEIGAVPEIRRQVALLTQQLLA